MSGEAIGECFGQRALVGDHDDGHAELAIAVRGEA